MPGTSTLVVAVEAIMIWGRTLMLLQLEVRGPPLAALWAPLDGFPSEELPRVEQPGAELRFLVACRVRELLGRLCREQRRAPGELVSEPAPESWLPRGPDRLRWGDQEPRRWCRGEEGLPTSGLRPRRCRES